MKSVCDIIIPSWNNPQFLIPCVQSIHNTGVLESGFAKLIIVNNGNSDISESFKGLQNTIIVGDGINHGWEGGLKLGLKHAEAPFVCFQNDDTLIPRASASFYNKLISPFSDDNIAAVGPATTTASGLQSVFHPQSPICPTDVPWLIFFCVMLRRSDLDAVGGVDDTLPGGDDFDLCMRFKDANKRMIIDPSAFLIHHGFVTGTRIHGDHTVKNGWNNIEFTDNVNVGLIKKHGFKKFISHRFSYGNVSYAGSKEDLEGNIIRSLLNGEENILELGCGHKKTVERAIGIDRIPKGDKIPNLANETSVADVQADVQNEIPFETESTDAVIARHILEHCLDSVQTIKNWARVLKVGGKLILAVPDEKVCNGIPLNPEHVHAFTEESLTSLMEMIGFKKISTQSAKNGVSFVGCYKKC